MVKNDFGDWLLSLFEKGLSFALIGPWWTGFMEMMRGFWGGLDQLLGTFMDQVTQKTKDEMFVLATTSLLILMAFVVISICHALHQAISCPIRVSRSISGGICIVVAGVMNYMCRPLVLSPAPPYSTAIQTTLTHEPDVALSVQTLPVPVMPVPVKSYCLRSTKRGTLCTHKTFDNQACSQH